MDSELRRRFDAAVSVIRGLPKDGPFKPSNEMLLNLYGLYKQAINGPCKEPKPSFWDVVKKAKWEAWTRLGNMASEEAMATYIRELLKIVEVMPQSDEVISFRGLLESASQPRQNAEAAAETAGDSTSSPLPGQSLPTLVTIPALSGSASPSPSGVDFTSPPDDRPCGDGTSQELTDETETADATSDTGRSENDSETDAFCDTSEVLEQHLSLAPQRSPSDTAGTLSDQETSFKGSFGGCDGQSASFAETSAEHRSANSAVASVEHSLCMTFRTQVMETVARLQADLAGALSRLEAVEQQLRDRADVRAARLSSSTDVSCKPWQRLSCLLRSTTAQTAILMLWPFFVFWLLNKRSRRHRR